MPYIIVGVIGALAGFIAGKALSGKRHGSAINGVLGAIGGFAAFVMAGKYYPPAVDGWPMTAASVVAGAFVLLFIFRMFVVRKPSAAARGRFS